MRIAIIGNSGSGKSTLASWLAARTGVPTLDLAALRFDPLLLFLNPGEQQCLDNCRARPWEAHKYPSKDEQDKRLAFLLSWVALARGTVLDYMIGESTR